MSDRQCHFCKHGKTIAEMYSRTKCKQCKADYNVQYQRDLRAGLLKKEPSTAWNLPADPRTDAQREIDRTMRDLWRWPVEPTQNLRWAA